MGLIVDTLDRSPRAVQLLVELPAFDEVVGVEVQVEGLENSMGEWQIAMMMRRSDDVCCCCQSLYCERVLPGRRCYLDVMKGGSGVSED